MKNAQTSLDRVNASDRSSLLAAAELLQRFGLCIATAHKHDAQGNIVSLPDDEVALEIGQKVYFVLRRDVPESAVPVAWRYRNDQLVEAAYCCPGPPEPHHPNDPPDLP